MMQKMVENSGDGWQYMINQLNLYYERVMSEDHKNLLQLPIEGPISEPLAYTEMQEPLKEIIAAPVAEMVRLLGVRTGEMHLALSASTDIADFEVEPFSLHYQRSLYSSFQSLVRSAFQGIQRNIKKLPKELLTDAEDVLNMKDAILKEFKKIYRKKIGVVKTRLHGDYHLGQVLNTGKDFVILDFEGEPSKSYSERRLKRSPLRDVAGMVRSFHYAAYGSLLLNDRLSKADIERLSPFAELWYHYMSGFFMKAYFETVKGSDFIPADLPDLEVLLQTYLLEKAVYELNYELNNRPDWLIIPIYGIKAVMMKSGLQAV
jgi:maltose alpha-D-glucosyltransferase/alpha-amylase